MSFVPDLSVLLTFTAAAIVVIVVPGPDIALFVGRTIAHGRADGLIALSGTLSGLLIHALLAAFGLSALLAASLTAFTIIKVAGALYLAWLAVQAIRHGSKLNLENQARGKPQRAKAFVVALGINLLNPKVVLFFLTFLPQFVSPGDPAASEKILFLGLYHIALSIPICVAMVLGADAIARQIKASPQVMRGLDYLMAGIFGFFAVRILAGRTG